MKAAREAWFEGQLDLDPARLIFIDEKQALPNDRLMYHVPFRNNAHRRESNGR